MLERYWINAPSTLQTHHKLDGARVLADVEADAERPVVRVYFAENTPLVSQEVDRLALSRGWPRR